MRLRRLTSALVALAAVLVVVDSAALVRRLGRSLASSLFEAVLVALTTAIRARIVARLTALLPLCLILVPYPRKLLAYTVYHAAMARALTWPRPGVSGRAHQDRRKA